jgi:hypothetical protein
VDSAFLNYRYAYDNKGMMISRSEGVINSLEQYEYDKLDRLTKITAGEINQPGVAQIFSYNNSGNITHNSKVGSYSYESSKPHAVTKIDLIGNTVIPTDSCAVAYNFFNQPTHIKEGGYELDLFYGANQQRNKMTIDRNNGNSASMSMRYYINKRYEKELDFANITRHYHYIYGDNGVVALHIANETDRTDSIYYIHTDHLGSYCALTNDRKEVRQRNYFDPWGNYKNIFAPNPFDPGTLDTLLGADKGIGILPLLNFMLTNRGFTCHEHRY